MYDFCNTCIFPCCSKFRTQLFLDKSRERKKNAKYYTSHDSHVNYRFLTGAQKDERLRNLEYAKRIERQKNKRLHQLILNEIESNRVELEPGDSEDMSSLTSGSDRIISRRFSSKDFLGTTD